VRQRRGVAPATTPGAGGDAGGGSSICAGAGSSQRAGGDAGAAPAGEDWGDGPAPSPEEVAGSWLADKLRVLVPDAPAWQLQQLQAKLPEMYVDLCLVPLPLWVRATAALGLHAIAVPLSLALPWLLVRLFVLCLVQWAPAVVAAWEAARGGVAGSFCAGSAAATPPARWYDL
jgi:hypothetical protein